MLGFRYSAGHFRRPGLLFLALLPLVLCHCGSRPGGGPTAAQIATRLQGHEMGTFQTPDGMQLGYVFFRPTTLNSRKAAFLYFHGIESHSEWFDEAARQLAAKGYPVISIDRRGSGINRENRGFVSGHVPRGIQLVDDIHRAVEVVKGTGRYDEIYLIGLSWGGKYIMAYEAAYPNEVNGLVQITPGMKPKVDMNWIGKLGVGADALVSPERQHPIPIKAEMFTTTPKFLNYIKNDPLKLHSASSAFLIQSTKMDRVINRHDYSNHPPLLVFLAGNDRIIDNQATRELVTRSPKRSVKIINYPDQTHSIQLDAPERLTADIVKWLKGLPRE